MEALVSCGHCKASISDTAVACPICSKRVAEPERALRKLSGIAAGAAVVLTGPVGVAAALFTGLLDFDANRQLKALARRLSAIDSIPLTSGLIVYVTPNDFVIVSTSVAGPHAYPGFLRSDIKAVTIDEHKLKSGLFGGERAVLKLDYFDRNYRKRFVSDEYKFTGKNSRAEATFALLKFLEYALSINNPLTTDDSAGRSA